MTLSSAPNHCLTTSREYNRPATAMQTRVMNTIMTIKRAGPCVGGLV